MLTIKYSYILGKCEYIVDQKGLVDADILYLTMRNGTPTNLSLQLDI